MNLIPVLILGVSFALGFPVAFSLIISVIPYFIMDPYISLNVIIQRLISSSESISLMAVPFFITAGTIMNYSGISSRLMSLAEALVGHLTGGLGHVNVLLSTLMGGISGSGAADCAMEAKLLVPEMEKRGYDRAFSAAVTAASACITPIIPPGVGLVVFAFVCEVSLGKLFSAGYLPGLMMMAGMMIYIGYISHKRGYKPSRTKRAPGKEIWKLTKEASWALFLPFGLIMGLRFGLFTATEGGAMMAVYSLIVGKFVYKELEFRHLPKIILESVLSMASVMLILTAANVFSYYLSWERIPQAMSASLIAISKNKYLFLVFVNILLLILGMFLDGMATMIILAPLLAPVATALGIDLIHFGLVMCLNSAIGAITPPFGTYIFIVRGIVKVKTETLIKELLPFIGVCIAVLLVVTYIPGIVMLIPNLLF
ncbi:MAG: TRAP transporter large permease [Spirochaetales bacterium]|jgi:tripartite ATP-independent transporter DctM subunit|nr:TRAP transporter large permease [Spirochaetales bacterium]